MSVSTQAVLNAVKKGETDMASAVKEVLTLSQLGMDKLPPGDYAMLNKDTGRIHFFTVSYGKTGGRWAGYTFVAEHSGPNRVPIRDKDKRVQILTAIGRDPIGCLKLYADENNVCGLCGLELTDPSSRSIGIGPVCRKKNFGLK